MKIFKKLLIVCLVLALACTLFACDDGDKNPESTTAAPVEKITVSLAIVSNESTADPESVTIDAGTTLKAFFEGTVAPDESFEDTLSYIEWLVNGQAATADTVLKDGDVITARLGGGIPNPDDPDNPNPDDPNPDNPNPDNPNPDNPNPDNPNPDDPKPDDPNPDNPNPDNPNPENPKPGDPDEKINITVILREEGAPETPMPFEVAKGCTVRELVESYLSSGNGTFEEFSMYYDVFVNEKAANANDTLAEDDVIVFVMKANPNPDNPNPDNPNPDNPNPENPKPGDPDEKINVTVVLRGDGVPEMPLPLEIEKDCTLREFIEGTFTSGGSKFEEVAMFYDIFVNEKAANPDVVLMDGDKITLTPKGNSDPEPDPDTIAVSFLTYHDGTLGASVVEYAPKGSTLKEFFELATGGSISFESTLQYTAWFVNGEAADANTVLKDGDEVEAYVTIGDVPNPDNPNPNPNPDPGTDPNIKPAPDPENPENPPITGSIQVNFTVDEGNQGSSMKYTVNTPCTLRQFYEEYADSGDFEDAIVKHDFFINGQLANGDALLSSDDEILMLRVPREGEIIIYFDYIVGNDYTESFAVVPAGTYQLDKLLVEYVFVGLFQSYEEIAASFDIYINEQPASASDIVRAEDLVLMHSKGFDGEDDLKYFYIEIGIEHGGQFIEMEEFPVLYDEGVALGTLYNEMLANIFGLSQEFDEFIWTVNDQPATADTPLKDGDCVYAARKK